MPREKGWHSLNLRYAQKVWPPGWESFKEEMGLPRPERRVDLGIRESGGGG